MTGICRKAIFCRSLFFIGNVSEIPYEKNSADFVPKTTVNFVGAEPGISWYIITLSEEDTANGGRSELCPLI